MKKLYQLCIEKLIYEDWSGTIYHSRLYPNKKACICGCVNDEILNIAEIVLRHEDSPHTPDIDPDEFQELYSSGDRKARRWVRKVQTWLHGKKSNVFMESEASGDQPVFREICGFEVVPKNKT
jgi:hypothetical protein